MVVVYAGAALAASVDEVEPNDSFAQAQNIDASFSLDEDPNITNPTTVPHATIPGTGSFTTDYYSFTVPEAGVSNLSVFDVDQDPAQFVLIAYGCMTATASRWLTVPILQVTISVVPIRVARGSPIAT